MNKHTPGPWRTGDEARDGTIRIFSEKPYGSVAEANSCYAGRVKHDAALIAAAPELLEALKLAEAALANHPGGDNRSAEDFRTIRCAIEKAEGRS